VSPIQSIKEGVHKIQLVVNELSTIELYVKGKRIVMNQFASKIVSDVFMAVLSNLKDVNLDRITKIEVT
jgi:hypothetical protein